jgi:hypothetical protein
VRAFIQALIFAAWFLGHLTWAQAATGGETVSSASRQDALLTEVSLLFDARRERARAYGEWVYEWAASYVSAYRIAGRVIASTASQPAGWRENVQEPISNYYNELVRERVTAPEEGAAALFQIVDRQIDASLYMLIEHEALQACGSDAPACLTRKRADLQAVASNVMAASRTPEKRAMQAQEATDIFSIPTEDDYYFLRATRPLISRFLVLALRLTEMASLVILFTAVIRLTPVPVTSATTTLVALIVAWGLDYGVHTVDAKMHQADFIEMLEGKIDDRRPFAISFAESRIAQAQSAFDSASAQARGATR